MGTQDAVLDEEEKRLQGKFLYAIVLSDRGREFGPIGLEGGRVYSIRYQDIAAVVSDHPVTEIKFLRKNLSPYHLTIRSVAEQCTTIPAKFGQVAADADRVRKLLQANYDEIKRELGRLQGKVEMGLKIFWTVENVYEYVVEKSRELKNLRARLLRNSASLTRQQQIDVGALTYDRLNEMRGEITEKVIRMLQDSTEEVEIKQLTEEKVVMLGSFLVSKDRRSDFDAAARKVADLLGEDYAIKVDGPWVPFSFARRIELFEILGEEDGAKEEKGEGVRGKAA
ncbi:MAG: GvpL/GvpF family gas vesicle protein [Deltaproteobacteria bacterium]|nr:GvpL/GvpF family gas vesicle protein [Deltaproteobacteria bacterium]